MDFVFNTKTQAYFVSDKFSIDKFMEFDSWVVKNMKISDEVILNKLHVLDKIESKKTIRKKKKKILSLSRLSRTEKKRKKLLLQAACFFIITKGESQKKMTYLRMCKKINDWERSDIDLHFIYETVNKYLNRYQSIINKNT